MAIILKTPYTQNIANNQEPLIYVDSINKESFVAEMYNYCIKYIREKRIASNTATSEYKREKFLAKDETDIYKNKPDGFWIVSDEKNRIITLCSRITYRGRIYDSTYVEEVFTLSCKECAKIVPQV